MTNRQLTWLLVPAIVGGVLALLMVLYLSIDSDANALRGASLECARSDQCEEVPQGRIFAEPQNTLSNLAYLFAGLCIFIRALRSGFNERRIPALMVGASFCFLALMSGYYHATLNDIAAAGVFPECKSTGTKTPQILDIVGVYLSLLSMICFGLDRLLRKHVELTAFNAPIGLVWIAWIGIVLINAVFALLMRTTFHFDSDLVFPVLVGILMAVLALNLFVPDGRNRPRFALGDILLVLSAFAIGIVCRVLDGVTNHADILTPHAMCSAKAVFQAHAVWHLMSALALLITFDLIENSSAPEGVDASGAALLPVESSLVGWLARPGGVMGRSVGALLFNIGFSMVALGFGVAMIVSFGVASLAALVPLGSAVYLWVVTYALRGVPAGSRL